MFQAVTAFSGGIWAANKLSDIQLPHVSRAQGSATTFRLHLRVVSASIPGLADPGLLTRERPRLEAVVAGKRKSTEHAEFKRSEQASKDGPQARIAKANCGQCSSPRSHPDRGAMDAASTSASSPWHFGETLTFSVRDADILGPGVQLWLRSTSDVQFGVFQVSMSGMRDIATGSVDFRRDILPFCEFRKQGFGEDLLHQGDAAAGPSNRLWETPVLVLPLARVGNDSSPYVLSSAAAHVSVAFGINVDPQILLRDAEERTMPLVDRVANPLMSWMEEPARWIQELKASTNCVSCDEEVVRVRRMARQLDCDFEPERIRAAANRVAASVGDSVPALTLSDRDAPSRSSVVGPDLDSDGWISHRADNGREFWHHMSLGPAPWADSRLTSGSSPVATQYSPEKGCFETHEIRTRRSIAPAELQERYRSMASEHSAGAHAADTRSADVVQRLSDVLEGFLDTITTVGQTTAQPSPQQAPRVNATAAAPTVQEGPRVRPLGADRVQSVSRLVSPLPSRASFPATVTVVTKPQHEGGMRARASFPAVGAGPHQSGLLPRSSFHVVEPHKASTDSMLVFPQASTVVRPAFPFPLYVNAQSCSRAAFGGA